MGRLNENLRKHRVYIDANIFIYAVEGVEPWASVLRDVFSDIDAGKLFAITSNLSLAECLVMPFKHYQNDLFRPSAEDLITVYRQVLSPRPYLNIAPIDDHILIFAARLRAETGLKLPDAIHAATALTQKCNVMLTNDAGFKRVPNIDVFLLSDWITQSC